MFAFLFGHMIPNVDRHPAGLRTVAMVSGIYAALATYRAFLDPGASDGVKASAKKNAFLMAFQVAFAIAAMSGLPTQGEKRD